MGKSLEKGGSVEKVDWGHNDGISRILATDPPCDPPQEIDYSTFPHLTSNMIEAKRNQAQAIRQQLLAATSREQLTAIKLEFGARCRWVWRKLLTAGERALLEAIAKAEQLNLFKDGNSSHSEINLSS